MQYVKHIKRLIDGHCHCTVFKLGHVQFAVDPIAGLSIFQQFFITNVEVQDTALFDTPIWMFLMNVTVPYTVYVSRVSYLFVFNAYDTYVLRMTHIWVCPKKGTMGEY